MNNMLSYLKHISEPHYCMLTVKINLIKHCPNFVPKLSDFSNLEGANSKISSFDTLYQQSPPDLGQIMKFALLNVLR